MPFAVKLLPGFQVDGTWNVPTTLNLVGCVPLGKEQAKLATATMNENDVRPPLRRLNSPLIAVKVKSLTRSWRNGNIVNVLSHF